MKATLLTTTTAGLAAFGLAVLPVFADDAPATPVKPAAEAVAANTVSVYLVQISGKG